MVHTNKLRSVGGGYRFGLGALAALCICVTAAYSFDGSVSQCSTSDDCDDGLFCNGAEQCDGGTCTSGEMPCEAGQTCIEDADLCMGVAPTPGHSAFVAECSPTDAECPASESD